VDKSAWDLPSSIFANAPQVEEKKFSAILRTEGDENAYKLHEELARAMLIDCTIERRNDALEHLIARIEEVDDRLQRVRVTDAARGRMNQGAAFVRHLENMVVLARVIAQSARRRDESRGAHFKPDFPQRDDANGLRTTLAFHVGSANGAHAAVRHVREFDYSAAGLGVHVTDAVDTSLVRPRPRHYQVSSTASESQA
jgi:succinate dehydrogenase / fumarate reductase flavoprotein subunit